MKRSNGFVWNNLDAFVKMLKDPDWRVRTAAMNACSGREIPLELIERWLKDPDYDFRVAAMNICSGRGIPLPVIRTIEPPELVYKKCVADVIVVAEIPKDAQVRGTYGHKCRASKAVIKEIIGDFCGEKVGISVYDLTTAYYEGDEIVIDNFDMSDEECSTGFHFFCTIDEARAY